MRRYYVVEFVTILVAVIIAYAACNTFAAPAKMPQLTQEQKIRVQGVIQQIQIAQLQVELAQSNLDKTKLQAQAALKDLAITGYDLNLATLEYTPTPKAEAKK